MGGWKAPPPLLHHTKKLGAYRVNNESLFSKTFCLRKFIQYVIDNLEYCGVFSTVGDIMINVGGYFEYRGVFSTMGDIMNTMGVILSSVGVFNTVGDIMMHVGENHEYRGGVQYRWGDTIL